MSAFHFISFRRSDSALADLVSLTGASLRLLSLNAVTKVSPCPHTLTAGHLKRANSALRQGFRALTVPFKCLCQMGWCSVCNPMPQAIVVRGVIDTLCVCIHSGPTRTHYSSAHADMGTSAGWPRCSPCPQPAMVSALQRAHCCPSSHPPSYQRFSLQSPCPPPINVPPSNQRFSLQ